MLALASDFDGTLFFRDDDPPFHPQDLEAIREFRRRGNLFALCTGRPINFLESLQQQIDFDFYICSTGAYIADRSRRVLLEKWISYETVCQLLAFGQGHPASFHLEQTFYHYQHSEDGRPMIRTASQLAGHRIHSMSFSSDTVQEAALLAKQINQRFAGQTAAFQNNIYVDVVPTGCSKGTGLTFCKEAFGLSKIAAIGDSQNDVPMFQHSDESFTFTYSPESVQKQATHVVKGLYEAVGILLHETTAH